MYGHAISHYTTRNNARYVRDMSQALRVLEVLLTPHLRSGHVTLLFVNTPPVNPQHKYLPKYNQRNSYAIDALNIMVRQRVEEHHPILHKYMTIIDMYGIVRGRECVCKDHFVCIHKNGTFYGDGREVARLIIYRVCDI